MQNDFLTAKQLAKRLNLSPETIKKWAIRGKIPHIRISPKVLRFDWQKVKETLQGGNHE